MALVIVQSGANDLDAGFLSPFRLSSPVPSINMTIRLWIVAMFVGHHPYKYSPLAIPNLGLKQLVVYRPCL